MYVRVINLSIQNEIIRNYNLISNFDDEDMKNKCV